MLTLYLFDLFIIGFQATAVPQHQFLPSNLELSPSLENRRRFLLH